MSNIQKDIYFINRLSSRIERLVRKKDRLWEGRCPLCGDSKKKKNKKRFYFYEKNAEMRWTCHNCGKGGKIISLLYKKYPDLIDEYKLFGMRKNTSLLDQAMDLLPKPKKETIQTPDFVTKKEFYELSTNIGALAFNHPARKYVQNRFIPFKRVRYCKNFYKFTSLLHQDDTFKTYAIPCLLIPFNRIDDKIEMFQARFFDPKVKPKYITVKFNESALKIYNKDFVDQSKRVYILEGPIDSMFVENAVAMAGADINLSFKDQVWVYDNEPYNKEITGRLDRRIADGEKVVIFRKSDRFKDINEAVVKGIVKEDQVNQMLIDRTFCGLKARLEFSKFIK